MHRLMIAALSTTAIVGCGTTATVLPAQSRGSAKATLAGGAPRHVAIIVMENEEYGSVIDSHSTPFINALARNGAVATQMYAISHPSLPNYLALTGGSTAGITADCTDCSIKGSGLAGQLAAKRISWKAYMEGMPRACFHGAEAGAYAKKHDPFMYYRALAADPRLCGHVVPYSQLSANEVARALPGFIWITPNLCHDMHDCPPSSGDRFLATMLPPLMEAMGARSLVVLTFDEGTSDDGCCRLARGGHILTVLTGPLARASARLRTPVDHFSDLQLIEDLLGLARLGGAACPCTPSLSPLLR